jgi:phospholipid/cholesterol/gamma-HCH transport system substrate-binding protein
MDAKRVRSLLLVVVLALLATGCDLDVYKLPLPGGTDTGPDPITVTAEFADVLDLVPQSTVKVNDVNVGKVTDIDLDGYQAVVTLELRADTKLPDNPVAELRQTSLLGEKFVALSAPEDGSGQGQLQSGDVIPLDQTGRNPEVEEVLGALSLLLNGGGVAQLKTIANELNLALEGREGSARSVLRQIEALMTQLDANKGDIVNAIESLNRLATSVNEQTGAIDAALEELPGALTSLDQQRDDLVRMLGALNRLGDVGVDVIQQSKQSTIESFRQLSPVLTELANSGDDFVNAFHVFLTYPFVDEVVGRDPQVARNLHMGDYTNLSIRLDLPLIEQGDLGPPNLPDPLNPGQILDTLTRCLQSGDLQSKACRKVLATPQALLDLKEECTKPKNEDKAVCKQLNLVPGLPGLPGLGSSTGDGGGLLGIPGLPRAPFGVGATPQPSRGPTMRQLMDSYDPALVSLLVPGMVVPR